MYVSAEFIEDAQTENAAVANCVSEWTVWTNFPWLPEELMHYMYVCESYLLQATFPSTCLLQKQLKPDSSPYSYQCRCTNSNTLSIYSFSYIKPIPKMAIAPVIQAYASIPFPQFQGVSSSDCKNLGY